ncbi:angiotensin-converting enzyme-like [Episyrphus balteatus]|uniref:angiotensin-converting enzyme-like n=1 Tax=Episyrphus balteatus TaxID=286459 RepID=UPI0024863C65|nr:angiotensin-converting enzyme-like [Episyrphus balteatus]
MAGSKLINLSGFGILVLAICFVNGKELNSNEDEARQFLNETSDEMFNFFDELVEKDYIFEVDIRLNQYKTNRNYINFVNQIVENAREFDFKNFKDEDLKYAFEILVKLADENIIGATRYSRILESLKELDYLTQYKEIPKYDRRNSFLAFFPDVFEIMGKSNDEQEIQHYWAAWKKITGEWAKDNLAKTLDGLKDAANLSDVTPFEFWSRGFNITDMEDALFEIQPLYLELHAFIRSSLQKQYGKSVIGPDGLIPDHLFKQLSTQASARDRVVEEIFPRESLPAIDLAIDKYTTKQLYEFADDFFASLGFERYPASMWGDRIRYKIHGVDDEEDDRKECRARVISKTPNIYLKFCENPDFWDFLEAYRNMDYIYYAKEMVGLPAYFFGAHVSLDYALGKAMVVSAMSHRNFKKIGMISEDVEIPKKVEMNRIFRMAMRRALYLPVDFLHAKAFGDLLSGKVELKDLNEHYWDLMKTYAGIKKPVGHATDTFDFPVNVYKELNDNQMSRDYTTEFFTFQIHKKLCELSGNYPKEPLYSCVISGSKEAGDALKKMMSLGKSKPFYQVIGTMFPENPKMSGDGMLEYYRPIKDILAKKNKEANSKLGWEGQLHMRKP